MARFIKAEIYYRKRGPVSGGIPMILASNYGRADNIMPLLIVCLAMPSRR